MISDSSMISRCRNRKTASPSQSQLSITSTYDDKQTAWISPPGSQVTQKSVLTTLIICIFLMFMSLQSVSPIFSRYPVEDHDEAPATRVLPQSATSNDVSLPQSNYDATSYDVRDGSNRTGLDFAIIGFPKTGTTFLLDVLGQHPEIVMPPSEFCQIHSVTGANETLDWMQTVQSSSPSRSANFVYGIKCPSMVRNTNAIENLAEMSDKTRLVVGVRHPVKWFESFYNYRVWGHYQALHLNTTIPTPFELTKGTNHWLDVSTALGRFDVYLRQLAKVTIAQHEIVQMLNNDQHQFWEKRISPNPFKVFIYTVEQLHDKNAARQQQFKLDLQEFLRLKTPLMQFDQMPKGDSHQDSSQYAEHLDICEPQFNNLRNQIVQDANRTSAWIIEKFIESNDVVVSGKDNFASILNKWSEDPCLK